MAMSICPACKLPLDIPPAIAGQQVVCPRCRATFYPPAPQAPAAPPAPMAVAPATSPYATPVPPPAGEPSVRPPADYERPVTLLDIFDLTFTRFVTPLIVKITWVVTLVLAAIWLIVLVVVLFADYLPDAAPRPRSQPTFNVEPDDLRWFANVVRFIILGTQVLGTFLGLLWVRVVLESITILFHMGASLKSIDRKTKRQI